MARASAARRTAVLGDAAPADSVVPAANAQIHRRRLLDQLEVSPRPRLIAVQGPAGYGKTVLLRQYCERRASVGDKVAWVRMDAHSADPAEFLRLLCEAAGSLLRPRVARTRDDHRSRPSTIQDFVRALRHAGGLAVIVVDNFEVAASVEIGGVLAQAVRALPDGAQLCVGTRALPGSMLTRLQIDDGTLMISDGDLCFRAAETMEFFGEFRDLRPEDIAEIHDRTNGWPAALQGFRLCLRRGGRYRATAFAGKGMTPELIDFLAAEMFGALEPAMQDLLLELGVPDKLSAGLVEHLTGSGNGTARLAEVERAGLFLSRTDLDGTWFRFHNLFRQFLVARAATRMSPDELRQRHRRVAQWYAERGYREEAIQHALYAGDREQAAALMLAVIDRLVAQERLGLIERYVEQLPTETLLRHEALVNTAIIAYGFRRAFDKADALIALHRRQLEQRGADAAEVGIHNVSRLFVLAAQDRIEELGATAVECATQLAERRGFKYAVTFNARAMLMVGRAEYEDARGLLLQARPLHDEDGSLFGQAYQEAIYSMSLSAQGRIDDAVRGLATALKRTEEQACGSISAGAVIAAYQASGCYEQNRIADAEMLIRDYAQLAEQQTIVDAVATMLLTAARIAHGQGRRAEAEEIVERVLYLGYKYALNRLIVYARAELARQASFDGELEHAAKWLAELPSEWTDTPGEMLMFHAGETEACTITYARHLIQVGRHAQAARLLGSEIRRARPRHRRRRELKLHILLALAHHEAGDANLAGRSLLDALEIGAAGGFVRSFLDERQPLIGLLKSLRASLAQLPRVAGPDVAVLHLDRLLHEAGETGVAGSAPAADADLTELIASLSEKERRLLRFLANGLSNKDLSDRLSVSTNTVKWHLRNIFEKLQIKNRVQAIALARRFGLID